MLTLTKLIRTVHPDHVEWHAWTDDGTHIHMHYRDGHGSVDAHYRTGLDDYADEPIAEFDTGDRSNDITLDGFLAYVADKVEVPETADIREDRRR